MKQHLMVFWKTEEFPYYESGTVLYFSDSGMVAIKENPLTLYEPEFVLPYDKGAEIAEDMEKLNKLYHEKTFELKKDFCSYVEKLFKKIDLNN